MGMSGGNEKIALEAVDDLKVERHASRAGS